MTEHSDDERKIILAKLATGGIANSAMLTAAFANKYDDLDLADCIEALTEDVLFAQEGNMKKIEGRLVAQISALDMIFSNLAFKALDNPNINIFEKLMKLALKAQSQSRASAQTLSDIKNPKPFIQNNKANYQQVNNNTPSPTREKKTLSNELLEEGTHEEEWLDKRTQKTPIRAN